MTLNRPRWRLPLLFLGFAMLRLPGQQVDADRKLVAQLRTEAERGDVRSQFQLGVMLLNGDHGVTRDAFQAVKWLQQAAEHDYATAQNELGLCYHNGVGVAKDDRTAVLWWRKAAEQNDAMAQCSLG